MTSEAVLKLYSSATTKLLQLLSALNEAQINAKPVGGGWTVAQIGDHLNRSYEVSFVLEGKVKKAQRDPSQKIPEIQSLFLNFNIKMDSPKEIVPSNGLIKKEILLASLKNKIKWMHDFSKWADLSKLCLDFKIPEYGPFTRLEWIGFNAIHTQRHNYQIEQIIKHIKA